jgi:hypothetical protein
MNATITERIPSHTFINPAVKKGTDLLAIQLQHLIEMERLEDIDSIGLAIRLKLPYHIIAKGRHRNIVFCVPNKREIHPEIYEFGKLNQTLFCSECGKTVPFIKAEDLQK